MTPAMNPTIERDFTKEVASGAQMLDSIFPSWYRLIDLETLQLSSCEKCVCGQLGRELGWGLFPEMNDFPAEFGFDIPVIWTDDLPDETPYSEAHKYELSLYVKLDEEWHKAITTRLKLDKLPAPVENKEEALA